jgi:hypothetical protein
MRHGRLTISLILWLAVSAARPLASAEWRMEALVCNNDFKEGWVMTPAAGIAIGWKWLSIGADASLGSYTPADLPEDYRTFSRVSFIPMLRLPLRRFFVQTGCGITAAYGRRQIWTGGDSYRFESSEGFHGEFRGEAGASIPFLDSHSLILKGGISSRGRNDRFFYAGLGFGIRPSRTRAGSAADAPESSEDRMPAGVRSGVRSAAVVGGTDDVSMRFNTAIESALIRRGIDVISRDKLKAIVDDRLRAEAKAANPKQFFNRLFTDSLSVSQLAFHAASLLPLDAIIETGVDYAIRTYGEEPVIQSSRIRLLVPETGSVVWSAVFDSPDPSLDHHMETVIRSLMDALPRARKAGP